MRAIIGFIVSLVVAAAVTAGLVGVAKLQTSWIDLAIGIAAGLAMRAVASGPKPSYLQGGLAAIATLAGVIGGQVGAAQLIRNQPIAVSTPAGVEAPLETDEGDATGVAVAPEEAPAPVLESETPTVAWQPKAKSDFEPLDVALLAIGCLLAYQLGKGGTAAPPAETTDEDAESSEGGSDGDAPAEPSDEERADG